MVPLIISQRQKLKTLKLSPLRPHLIEDLEKRVYTRGAQRYKVF